MTQIPTGSIDLVVTSPPYPMIEMWDEMFGEENQKIREALDTENGALAFELMNQELDRIWNEAFRVLTNGGNSAITTLVQSSRWSNRYLNMLAGSGALIPRSPDELLSAFNDMEMQVTQEIKGNLAFIKYG